MNGKCSLKEMDYAKNEKYWAFSSHIDACWKG